jgi:hypothetical protein
MEQGGIEGLQRSDILDFTAFIEATCWQLPPAENIFFSSLQYQQSKADEVKAIKKLYFII